ncbi:hypothetical protein R50073_24470 [Maricurvus nonylphenolicus]|uniref:hypothetical protein n=1 Tax=Maricurvus nonylphenolicus TaxID=1008307 RepID=UPI0036F2C25C
MDLHYFDSITGEYIATTKAEIDPLESSIAGKPVYMKVPHTTFDSPIEVQTGFACVREGGKWTAKEDHRASVIYSVTDKSEKKISDFGPIPTGYTKNVPGEFDKWVDGEWVCDQTAALLNEQQISCYELDILAGEARARFISPGEGTLEEYNRAYQVAKEFKDANYEGEIPSAIADNMRYKSLSAQESTDDILAEALGMNQVLDTIRSLRLDGKLAINNAKVGDNIEAIKQPFIDALEAIKPQ